MHLKTIRSTGLALAATLLGMAPAFAVTDGDLDGNTHPYVGLMVAQDAKGTPLWRCSGTLLSPTIYLTFPRMWELREITDPAELPTQLPAEGVIQLTDPATGQVRSFRRVASLFDDTTTFFIDHKRWAVWNLVHLGGPAHPIHIHMSQFQMLTRRAFENVTPFDIAVGGTNQPLATPVEGLSIEKYEEGWKDVFRVQPGEWVTVAGEFAGATGEFMYHCHILDHEDEGMMRPFVVHPSEVARFHVHPGGDHGHS